MAAKQPTKYEIAQLRLRAFESLQGWCVFKLAPEKEKPPEAVLLNMDERMKYARQLSDWAMKD